MRDQIRFFHNEEFGSLEILMINDKPYFPAIECARVLGYKNPRDAVQRHCKGDPVVKRDGVSFTTNQHGVSTQQTVEKNYISEGNLYRLVVHSKLPTAVRFESWIFDEVVPVIRKYGAYVHPDVIEEMQRSTAFATDLLNRLRTEQEKSAQFQEANLALTPKALYTDLVLQAENSIPITIIAKEYGMSANTLNSILHAYGVQYKVGGTWQLYQKYTDLGYTVTHTHYKGDRVAWVHTRWTQKGRHFLCNFLKKKGYVHRGDHLSHDGLL